MKEEGGEHRVAARISLVLSTLSEEVVRASIGDDRGSHLVGLEEGLGENLGEERRTRKNENEN